MGKGSGGGAGAGRSQGRGSSALDIDKIVDVQLNRDTALKMADTMAEQQNQNLTPVEVRALQAYSGIQYGGINSHLRGINPGVVTDWQRDVAIPAIKSAINKSKLAVQTVLYRADLGSASGHLSLRPGDTWVTQGFTSTSLSAVKASDFLSTGAANQSMFRITAAKGARALVFGKTSVRRGEMEVLLPHGARFKVTKVTTETIDGTKVRMIHATYK